MQRRARLPATHCNQRCRSWLTGQHIDTRLYRRKIHETSDATTSQPARRRRNRTADQRATQKAQYRTGARAGGWRSPEDSCAHARALARARNRRMATAKARPTRSAIEDLAPHGRRTADGLRTCLRRVQVTAASHATRQLRATERPVRRSAKRPPAACLAILRFACPTSSSSYAVLPRYRRHPQVFRARAPRRRSSAPRAGRRAPRWPAPAGRL